MSFSQSPAVSRRDVGVVVFLLWLKAVGVSGQEDAAPLSPCSARWQNLVKVVSTGRRWMIYLWIKVATAMSNGMSTGAGALWGIAMETETVNRHAARPGPVPRHIWRTVWYWWSLSVFIVVKKLQVTQNKSERVDFNLCLNYKPTSSWNTAFN